MAARVGAPGNGGVKRFDIHEAVMLLLQVVVLGAAIAALVGLGLLVDAVLRP